MNIQQINGSGHNIWVFAVTSITALSVTGLIWYLIEAVNDIRASAHLAQDQSGHEILKYRRIYRIYMCVWLIANGHLTWMCTSGAWVRILMNDHSLFSPSAQDDPDFTPYPIRQHDWGACDYVAYFMSTQNCILAREKFNYHPFK